MGPRGRTPRAVLSRTAHGLLHHLLAQRTSLGVLKTPSTLPHPFPPRVPPDSRGNWVRSCGENVGMIATEHCCFIYISGTGSHCCPVISHGHFVLTHPVRVASRYPRDPGKSENAWFLRGCCPGGQHLFEFLKMHLYQYTQKIGHCSNKFDFLPLFCLVGL